MWQPSGASAVPCVDQRCVNAAAARGLPHLELTSAPTAPAPVSFIPGYYYPRVLHSMEGLMQLHKATHVHTQACTRPRDTHPGTWGLTSCPPQTTTRSTTSKRGWRRQWRWGVPRAGAVLQCSTSSTTNHGAPFAAAAAAGAAAAAAAPQLRDSMGRVPLTHYCCRCCLLNSGVSPPSSPCSSPPEPGRPGRGARGRWQAAGRTQGGCGAEGSGALLVSASHPVDDAIEGRLAGSWLCGSCEGATRDSPLEGRAGPSTPLSVRKREKWCRGRAPAVCVDPWRYLTWNLAAIPLIFGSRTPPHYRRTWGHCQGGPARPLSPSSASATSECTFRPVSGGCCWVSGWCREVLCISLPAARCQRYMYRQAAPRDPCCVR